MVVIGIQCEKRSDVPSGCILGCMEHTHTLTHTNSSRMSRRDRETSRSLMYQFSLQMAAAAVVGPGRNKSLRVSLVGRRAQATVHRFRRHISRRCIRSSAAGS